MKHAIFIVGPAGTGKTSLCHALQDYLLSEHINAHYFNLDPASYEPLAQLDIRHKWNFSDYMRLHQLGPNGALMNILQDASKDTQWFIEVLGDLDNDFLLVDCPGQMEVYIGNDNSITSITNIFKDMEYSLCNIFTIDATFLRENEKLTSALTLTLCTMMHFYLPLLTVVTKMDLATDIKSEEFQDELELRFSEISSSNCPKGNVNLLNLIDKYGTSAILPLNVSDIDTIAAVCMQLRSMLLDSDDYKAEKEISDDFDSHI